MAISTIEEETRVPETSNATESEDIAVTLLEKVQVSSHVWFKPEMDRSSAEILLKNVPVGLFIIRASSLPRTLALSLQIPAENPEALSENGRSGTSLHRIEHYLIETCGPQLSLEGSEAAFSTLSALVHYYAQNRLVTLIIFKVGMYNL